MGLGETQHSTSISGSGEIEDCSKVLFEIETSALDGYIRLTACLHWHPVPGQHSTLLRTMLRNYACPHLHRPIVYELQCIKMCKMCVSMCVCPSVFVC